MIDRADTQLICKDAEERRQVSLGRTKMLYGRCADGRLNANLGRVWSDSEAAETLLLFPSALIKHHDHSLAIIAKLQMNPLIHLILKDRLMDCLSNKRLRNDGKKGCNAQIRHRCAEVEFIVMLCDEPLISSAFTLLESFPPFAEV
jgi:hypothetical protein